MMQLPEFVEGLRNALYRRFPRCRDCADDGPICPHSSLPCDLASHFDKLRDAVGPPPRPPRTDMDLPNVLGPREWGFMTPTERLAWMKRYVPREDTP